MLATLTAAAPQSQTVARGFASQLLREIITRQLVVQSQFNDYLSDAATRQQLVDHYVSFHELNVSGTLGKLVELQLDLRKHNKGEIDLQQLLAKYRFYDTEITHLAKLQQFKDDDLTISGSFAPATDGRSLLNAEQLVSKLATLVTEYSEIFSQDAVERMYATLEKAKAIVAEMPQSKTEKAMQTAKLQNLLQVEFEHLIAAVDKLQDDYLTAITEALNIDLDRRETLTKHMILIRKYERDMLFVRAMLAYDNASTTVDDYINTVEQDPRQKNTAWQAAAAKLSADGTMFFDFVSPREMQHRYNEIALQELQGDIDKTELEEKYTELFNANQHRFRPSALIKLQAYLLQNDNPFEALTGIFFAAIPEIADETRQQELAFALLGAVRGEVEGKSKSEDAARKEVELVVTAIEEVNDEIKQLELKQNLVKLVFDHANRNHNSDIDPYSNKYMADHYFKIIVDNLKNSSDIGSSENLPRASQGVANKLLSAVQKNDTDTISATLQAKNLNADLVIDDIGTTLLQPAAGEGKLRVVTHLLDKLEANPNIKNYKGFTALDTAIFFMKSDVVDFLKARDAASAVCTTFKQEC